MSWTATRRNASSQRSLIPSTDSRFPHECLQYHELLRQPRTGVHPTKKSERGSTQKLAALHRIAGSTRSRRCLPRAFGDGGGSNARSKITAVAERIHLDTEYRACREARRSDSLLRHCRGARHFDAPIDILPVLILGEF